MDTEDQILKGTKLITKSKKSRVEVDSQKYNVKKAKQNKKF